MTPTSKKVDARGLLEATSAVKKIMRVFYRGRTVTLTSVNGLSYPVREAEVSGFAGRLPFQTTLTDRLRVIRDLDQLIDIIEDDDSWSKGFSIGWRAATEEYKVGDFAVEARA